MAIAPSRVGFAGLFTSRLADSAAGAHIPPMTAKFLLEKHHVELLTARLGETADGFSDPNDGEKSDAGIDVIASIAGRRIGIQVGVIDPNREQGKVRAEEKRLASRASNGVYFMWGENDPAAIIAGIGGLISRKARFSFARKAQRLDEIWLLAIAGSAEGGGVASTMILSSFLDLPTLDDATSEILEKSSYDRVFILPELSNERALYEWVRSQGWTKRIEASGLGDAGPDLLQIINDPRWLTNPDKACEEEIARILWEAGGRPDGGE